MSVKCLILSGIPHSVSILDLEYALKKIFHHDAIDNFYIADFTSETKSYTKKVTINFDSSTDAMLAHNILDGYEYRLPTGKLCKIYATLANINSSFRSPSPETSHRRRHGRDYERTDIVPSGYHRHNDMYSSISKKLDSQIEVLMKQKKLLELERQVMRQKKRLKAEMAKLDVSDSDEEQKKRKRRKSSTPSKLGTSQSQVNWDRVRSASRSRSRSRERRHYRSRSRERYTQLRSRERRRTRSRSRERRHTRSRSRGRRRTRSRSRERRRSRSPLKKQRSLEDNNSNSLTSPMDSQQVIKRPDTTTPTQTTEVPELDMNEKIDLAAKTRIKEALQSKVCKAIWQQSLKLKPKDMNVVYMLLRRALIQKIKKLTLKDTFTVSEILEAYKKANGEKVEDGMISTIFLTLKTDILDVDKLDLWTSPESKTKSKTIVEYPKIQLVECTSKPENNTLLPYTQNKASSLPVNVQTNTEKTNESYQIPQTANFVQNSNFNNNSANILSGNNYEQQFAMAQYNANYAHQSMNTLGINYGTWYTNDMALLPFNVFGNWPPVNMQTPAATVEPVVSPMTPVLPVLNPVPPSVKSTVPAPKANLPSVTRRLMSLSPVSLPETSLPSENLLPSVPADDFLYEESLQKLNDKFVPFDDESLEKLTVEVLEAPPIPDFVPVIDEKIIEETPKVPIRAKFLLPIKQLTNQMKQLLTELDFNEGNGSLNVVKQVLRKALREIMAGQGYMNTSEIVKLFREHHPKENDKEFLEKVMKDFKDGKYARQQNEEKNVSGKSPTAELSLKSEKDGISGSQESLNYKSEEKVILSQGNNSHMTTQNQELKDNKLVSESVYNGNANSSGDVNQDNLHNNIQKTNKTVIKPKFALPVKIVLNDMDFHLNSIEIDETKLSAIRVFIRRQIQELMEGKDKMNTKSIVNLYRERYPKELDADVIQNILNNLEFDKLKKIELDTGSEGRTDPNNDIRNSSSVDEKKIKKCEADDVVNGSHKKISNCNKNKNIDTDNEDRNDFKKSFQDSVSVNKKDFMETCDTEAILTKNVKADSSTNENDNTEKGKCVRKGIKNKDAKDTENNLENKDKNNTEIVNTEQNHLHKDGHLMGIVNKNDLPKNSNYNSEKGIRNENIESESDILAKGDEGAGQNINIETREKLGQSVVETTIDKDQDKNMEICELGNKVENVLEHTDHTVTEKENSGDSETSENVPKDRDLNIVSNITEEDVNTLKTLGCEKTVPQIEDKGKNIKSDNIDDAVQSDDDDVIFVNNIETIDLVDDV